MKHAISYFENHTSVARLYFTSDNLAFFDEENATNHARNLEDHTVTSITREEAEEELNNLDDEIWDDDYFLDETE